MCAESFSRWQGATMSSHCEGSTLTIDRKNPYTGNSLHTGLLLVSCFSTSFSYEFHRPWKVTPPELVDHFQMMLRDRRHSQKNEPNPATHPHRAPPRTTMPAPTDYSTVTSPKAASSATTPRPAQRHGTSCTTAITPFATHGNQAHDLLGLGPHDRSNQAHATTATRANAPTASSLCTQDNHKLWKLRGARPPGQTSRHSAKAT
jgi:hypothetical protein